MKVTKSILKELRFKPYKSVASRKVVGWQLYKDDFCFADISNDRIAQLSLNELMKDLFEVHTNYGKALFSNDLQKIIGLRK